MFDSRFIAQLQQLVQRLIRSTIAEPRLAIVRQLHPSLYAAKVQFLPEGASGNGVDALSGWLPIQSDVIGETNPPMVGEQVMVVFQEHDRTVGSIAGRHHDLVNLPPQNNGQMAAKSGERWYTHPKTGAGFRFLNTGDVYVYGPGSSNAQAAIHFDPAGDVVISALAGAKVQLSSDTEVDVGNATMTLQTFILSTCANAINSHTHTVTGVAAGSVVRTTGGPNGTLINPSDITTVAKAN